MLKLIVSFFIFLPVIVHGISVTQLGSCHHLDIDGKRICVHIVKSQNLKSFEEIEADCKSVQGYLPYFKTEEDLTALRRILYWHGFRSSFAYFDNETINPYFERKENYQFLNWTMNGFQERYPVYHWESNVMKMEQLRSEPTQTLCFRDYKPKIKCNDDFVMYEETGACFKAYAAIDNGGTGYNASECHKKCLSVKSQMAVFDSMDELYFVNHTFIDKKYSRTRKPCPESAWPLHSYDVACRGFWTGHRLPAAHEKNGVKDVADLPNHVFNMDGSKYKLFENHPWNQGEPNSLDYANRMGEHCIEILIEEKKFNDFDCSRKNGCLCRNQADRT